jgi:hypothetical protein
MAYEDDIAWASNYVRNYNPNETVNYNDSRLTSIEAQRQAEQKQVNDTYSNMINNSDQYYNNLINTQKDYMDKQTEIQNANTEQTIKEINQKKDKTERDYLREQRGAYQDYRNQINNYGVNAEIRASQGLNNTGYAESSNVSMYNTWQNRVTTARQSLQDSMQQFDNMITQARLSNNETLAEIAYNFAKAQAQYALEGFQYKNTLIENQQSRLSELGARYDTKYQNMLNQINNELSARRDLFNTANTTIYNYNKLKQDQDQFEKQMAYQREKDAIARAQSSSSGGRSYSSRSGSGSSSGVQVSNTNNERSINTLTGLVPILKYPGVTVSKRNAVDKAVQNGKITSSEANRLFDYYKM